jgi:hypothetical protein
MPGILVPRERQAILARQAFSVHKALRATLARA